jgi:hypothetical protein
METLQLTAFGLATTLTKDLALFLIATLGLNFLTCTTQTSKMFFQLQLLAERLILHFLVFWQIILKTLMVDKLCKFG